MDFATELEALTGTATDAWDIKAGVRRCYLYDFVGQPVRLWDGQGVLTAGGEEWIGTYDANGNNRHKTANVRDTRDGTSPRYEFGIPYMDAATYAALKADQALAYSRDIICYNVLCKVGEGLIPTTALRWNWRLAIRGVKFRETMEGPRGQERKVYSATAIAKSLEYERSRVPNGTMTDTAQRERARVLGVTQDDGCAMVSQNSRRTYIIPGG